MSYTHLTLENRVCIFHQKALQVSNAEVGRRIGRHRATVGRELKRFGARPSWRYLKQYFPDDPAMRVSHAGIYKYIKADRVRGGSLCNSLRRVPMITCRQIIPGRGMGDYAVVNRRSRLQGIFCM